MNSSALTPAALGVVAVALYSYVLLTLAVVLR